MDSSVLGRGVGAAAKAVVAQRQPTIRTAAQMEGIRDLIRFIYFTPYLDFGSCPMTCIIPLRSQVFLPDFNIAGFRFVGNIIPFIIILVNF